VIQFTSGGKKAARLWGADSAARSGAGSRRCRPQVRERFNRIAGGRASGDDVTLTFGPPRPSLDESVFLACRFRRCPTGVWPRGRQKRTQPPPPQTFKAYGLTPVLHGGSPMTSFNRSSAGIVATARLVVAADTVRVEAAGKQATRILFPADARRFRKLAMEAARSQVSGGAEFAATRAIGSQRRRLT
jgi:hypothetical protein